MKKTIKNWLGINQVEERIKRADESTIEIIKLAHEVMRTARENNKKSFAWTVQEEERELIKDGHKYREIIKYIK